MPQNFHHIAISTPDLDRALGFYRGVIGLEPISDITWSAGNVRINQVMGLPDTAARTVMLQGGNLCIELFQFELPEQPAPDAELRPVHHYGITHFCLDVKDIHRVHERLAAAGVRFHAPPQDFGEVKATYARDPDGNVFEIQEIL